MIRSSALFDLDGMMMQGFCRINLICPCFFNKRVPGPSLSNSTVPVHLSDHLVWWFNTRVVYKQDPYHNATLLPKWKWCEGCPGSISELVRWLGGPISGPVLKRFVLSKRIRSYFWNVWILWLLRKKGISILTFVSSLLLPEKF